MPELPEVEVVRRGLQTHVVGKTITAVQGAPPPRGAAPRGRPCRPDRPAAGRPDRRQPTGAASICGCTLGGAAGVDGGSETGPDTALVVHLGMSGQMLLGVVPRRRVMCGSPRCSTTGRR